VFWLKKFIEIPRSAQLLAHDHALLIVQGARRTENQAALDTRPPERPCCAWTFCNARRLLRRQIQLQFIPICNKK
jgi:hypothetical protein